MAALGRKISLTYARAVNETLAASHLSAKDLDAIAAHGQTLYHAPPDTIQWFDPALVAAKVGCAVISDFRRADCAAGGQGAPLVPFADYVLFRHPTKNRVLLNIGGIANITILKAGDSLQHVVAFDTGPGNCVSDWLARRFDPTGPGFDEDGKIAKCGSIDPGVEAALKQSPYLKRSPPKSTDGPEMIGTFERAMEKMSLAPAPEYLFTTAAWWTGWSILREIPDGTDQIIASGGGTQNAYVMEMLRRSGIELRTTAELGIPNDAKEAVAFAILGAATLEGIPSNVPSVTGARRPVVLGSLTPKP
jgi:anhydro-N-acetylmuramic acid kinase